MDGPHWALERVGTLDRAGLGSRVLQTNGEAAAVVTTGGNAAISLGKTKGEKWLRIRHERTAQVPSL